LTLFVVGRIVEREGDALKELITDTPGLWDVNSHGYSHIRIVRKIPWSKPQPSPRLIEHEMVRGAEVVRKILDRPCRGISPAGGVSAGFRGHPDNLNAMRAAGCTWSSAYARAVFGETNPTDLYGPFTYAEDGFPGITELPMHGWPDCTLKGAAGPALGEQQVRHPQYIIKWPSPWNTPQGFVQSPEEECEVHKHTIDVVAGAQLPFCCLIFHPWCLVRDQDPGAKVIDLLIRYARDQGHEISTLDAEATRCSENPDLLSPAPPVPETRDPDFDPGTIFA
jgi:hypothetical protein